MSGGIVGETTVGADRETVGATATDSREMSVPGPDETGGRGNPVDSLLTGTGWTRQDVVVAGTVLNVALFALLVYIEVRD